ncbi:hypothetical protein [Litorimonas haliclonae]|uniref:hypothetical protein n=1 Tax=Litorimonas haliclonae TaxID=2081977 RepID=UPI0039EE54A8
MTSIKQLDKLNMRQLCRWLSEQSDRDVSFVEFDGTRLHFGVQENWTLRSVDLNGTVHPAGRVALGGYPKYFSMACYPCQIADGDAVFMIRNHLTQEPHNRFGTAA